MPEGGTGKTRTRRKSRKKSQVTEKNSGAINEAPSPTDARNALNLSTDNSLFPREIHNFPVAQYYGKRPGIGLLQDGKIRLGDPYADI